MDNNKHKFRFLNYKKYQYFELDLNNNLIPLDAIVFIQDRHIIWARGEEYICNVYMRDDTLVDLHDYLKTSDAEATYQQKLEYVATESTISDILSRLGLAEGSIESITSIVEEINNAIQNLNITTNVPKLVTLTTSQYQALVDADEVDADTYYFTYDGEEEPSNWVFGDKFPVIFTNTWTFGGTFPIKLN